MFFKKNKKEEDKPLYNSDELYVLNLADLYMCELKDFKNAPIYTDIYGLYLLGEEYCFTNLPNEKNSQQSIIFQWVENENGERYLEDILTGTKIYLFERYNGHLIDKIESENISHITTEGFYPHNGFFDKNPEIDGVLKGYLDKILKEPADALAISVYDLKPLDQATEEQQVSLFDYKEKNASKLKERSEFIDKLKDLQYQTAKKYAENKMKMEEAEREKKHAEDVKASFPDFANEMKKKVKVKRK